MYTSLYLLVKIILISIIIILFRIDWMNKCPLNGVKEIQSIGNEWILLLNNEVPQHYDNAVVLIQNTLFLLIQFTNPTQKRFIVLFHDQVTSGQLRSLYLKMAQN